MKKTCTKCSKEKEVEEFHKDKNNSSGYRACCKVCFKLIYQDKAMQEVYYVQWRNLHYEERRERRKKGLPY